jgi:hypothetical protein
LEERPRGAAPRGAEDARARSRPQKPAPTRPRPPLPTPYLSQAPIDDNTKTLLLVALGLLGAAGLLGAGRAAVSSLSQRLASGAQKLVLLGAFWIAVFLAARAILEL